jgi:hypothetical protein
MVCGAGPPDQTPGCQARQFESGSFLIFSQLFKNYANR